MKAASLFALIFIFAAAALLQGCEAGPNVHSDYDRAADFGAYRTFSFVARPATDKSDYSALLTQLLKNAVTGEMLERGYALGQHPQLLVDFSARVRDKQSVESVTTPYYGGYPPGRFAPWPGYVNSTQTVNYEEGTLIIDLVDAAKRQMVWQGVGVGEISSLKMRDLAGAVNKAVADIFAKYPFRAGQARPIEAAGG